MEAKIVGTIGDSGTEGLERPGRRKLNGVEMLSGEMEVKI
jgi:hypothetical protein